MTDTELLDTLTGLHAGVDTPGSGIRDPALLRSVSEYLLALDEDEYRAKVSRVLVSAYLGPEAVEDGYGPEDALSFLRWMEDNGMI